MANIQNWLNKIKSAIYGREVREALHESIKAVNDELIETTARSVTTQTNLNTEISNRKNADTTLEQKINNEITNRTNADSNLQSSIDTETGNREAADTELRQSIDDEVTERENADNEFRGDISELKDKAHTHNNKTVLDEITEERLSSWDSMGSNGTYIMELISGLMTDLVILQTAMGIIVYDGGLFEQEYDETTLDGGDFDGEPSSEFDCGGFEPIIMPSGTTISSSVDGGQY